jgi:hypothetical protein
VVTADVSQAVSVARVVDHVTSVLAPIDQQRRGGDCALGNDYMTGQTILLNGGMAFI